MSRLDVCDVVINTVLLLAFFGVSFVFTLVLYDLVPEFACLVVISCMGLASSYLRYIKVRDPIYIVPLWAGTILATAAHVFNGGFYVL